MGKEAFLSSRVGELIQCDKHINTKKYINIIDKGQLPTIDKLFSSVT